MTCFYDWLPDNRCLVHNLSVHKLCPEMQLEVQLPP